MPAINTNFSNQKQSGLLQFHNNGSKNENGDDNLSVKMLDDDNSSFGSRCINTLQSAPRLDSYRKSALHLSAKRSSIEMEDANETNEANGDKSMTTSEQKKK